MAGDEEKYEYRIMAYFSEESSYGPRSYKRKVFTSYQEALAVYDEAVDNYSSYKGFDKAVIERRKITDWEKYCREET